VSFFLATEIVSAVGSIRRAWASSCSKGVKAEICYKRSKVIRSSHFIHKSIFRLYEGYLHLSKAAVNCQQNGTVTW
jgi:hypothetical protein